MRAALLTTTGLLVLGVVSYLVVHASGIALPEQAPGTAQAPMPEVARPPEPSPQPSPQPAPVRAPLTGQWFRDESPPPLEPAYEPAYEPAPRWTPQVEAGWLDEHPDQYRWTAGGTGSGN